MGAPRFAVAAAVVAVLWGCGFHGQRARVSDSLPPTQPAALLSDGTTKDPYQELFQYSIGNGDGLEVVVAGHAEFSGKTAVDQRGRIPIPNSTQLIDVSGLTLREAEGRVAQTIAPYVVGKPEVRVSLVESRSKSFYVLGGVWSPGLYRMNGSIVKLREAIAAAGFFREYRGDSTRVGVITPDPVKPTYVVVNVHNILMGEEKEDVIVKPGDIVFVQDRIIYDIDGFLYTLFRETENASTANKAVEFWEDALHGKWGDFTYPRSSVTVIY